MLVFKGSAMRFSSGFAAVSFLLASLACAPASAQELLATYQNWNLFKSQADGRAVCYIGSVPVKKEGNYKKRGQPYVLVTARGKSDEISVTSGFAYRKDSVTLKVDGKRMGAFFTEGEMAWTVDETDDTATIAAMKKGATLVVSGTSQKGTDAQDSYALSGFSQALQALRGNCR